MTSPARISVLASGGGSNLQALIDHFAGRAASAGVITFVASERAEAGALDRARAAVVRAFRGRILNVHPALLPSFGGPGMYGMRIHHAVLDHGAALTGVTVHFVDEHFDRGPIIAQWPVPVLPGDDATVLAARVLRTEHRLLPLCVAAVASGAIVLGEDGRMHGHLDIPGSVHAPEWRFALAEDAAGPSPEFATDVARLFPR